jgi:hypothetical protein
MPDDGKRNTPPGEKAALCVGRERKIGTRDNEKRKEM